MACKLAKPDTLSVKAGNSCDAQYKQRQSEKGDYSTSKNLQLANTSDVICDQCA